MSQLYDIYQSDTFHLARSIVIKFDLVSEAINKELSFRGYPVAPDFPASYKYYLNLSGEYHASDHDLLMQQYGSHHIMVDVATNTGYESVPFTKELFHGDTANRSLLNEYQLGSNFYNRLVVKYPQFETLIRGVLSPIDINEAINAPNGAILSIANRHRLTRDNGEVYYATPANLRVSKITSLIQSQEHNLITELQSWVSKSLFRWVVGGYSISDDLYVPFVIGILSSMLPSKIMNIRWKNARTSYAHTFHIKEYLNSHGLLGKYVQFIPLTQVMYLYRNVQYLELNLGKTTTFDELVDNMLTPTNVPMAGYYLKHDISDMRGEDGALLPETRMAREHINFKSLGAGSDRRDIREILDREVPLARENYRYIDNVEQETRTTLKWAGDDELMTKVLESELTDIADPIPVTLLSQLVWFWAYLSSQELYTGSIFVSNPVNGERIALTPLNAFILMIYCTNVSGRNQHLEYIPNDIVTAHWITKSSNVNLVPPEGGYHVKPSFDVMRNQTDKTHITDETILNIMGDFEGEYSASDPIDFLEKVKYHYQNLSRMFFTVCKIENAIGHGYGEHIWYNMFWHDIPVRLTKEPVKYADWLPRLGINMNYFTNADYDKLSVDLMTECTGLNAIVDIDRVELQRSMIEILKHFGSYTTHYLHSANQTAVTTSSGKYIRVIETQVLGNASLEEGIYIAPDMFNDRVDAVIEQSLGLTSPDVVGYGLEDTSMLVSLDPSFEVNAGEMKFGSIMPMAHMEILREELSYDNTPTIRIPVPPQWTTLYEYGQYISSPYMLFDTQFVTGDAVSITADMTDFPDVLDTMTAGTLEAVSGTIELVTETMNTDVTDSMNVGTLTDVTISSEMISSSAFTGADDYIGVGLIPYIGVAYNLVNVDNHKDYNTVGVDNITGDVNDAIVVDMLDSASVTAIDVTGTTQDASQLSDAISVGDIDISSNIYDEPELIEDAIVIVDSATMVISDEPDISDSSLSTLDNIEGEVVDDRSSTQLASAQTEVINVSGAMKDIESIYTTVSSATSNVITVTADVNDAISKVYGDAARANVTKVTGTSTDVKLPKSIRDVTAISVTKVTGDSYDLPGANVFDGLEADIELTMFIGDDYNFTLVNQIASTIEDISGEVYDEVSTNYGNPLSFDVMSVSGKIYDAYVPPNPGKVDITLVTTEGQVADDKVIPSQDDTTISVTDVTGSATDRRVEELSNSLDVEVSNVVMRVTDDIELMEDKSVIIECLDITGTVDDLTEVYQLGGLAEAHVTTIKGEVYDESTIDVINRTSINIDGIKGIVRDDRNKDIRDDYWHRVSNVTGSVRDMKLIDYQDDTSIEIIAITGEGIDPDGDIGILNPMGIDLISITGHFIDGVVNTYHSKTEVNLLTINGNTVDDNALFNRMSNTVEVVKAEGQVLDEVKTLYVNNASVTPVDVTGEVWDLLPNNTLLNNNITIVSINGDTTDENE